ncbi:MAG: S41 family peptidase [Woeseiaceae bacterium]
MKSMTRTSIILGSGLVLGVMLSIGQGVLADKSAMERSVESIPLEDIRSLSEVFGKIKQNYVEDVSDKELIKNAISGLLSGLDPHSAYLDKEAFTELREGTSGEFGGLGIVVGMEEGFVKVISPIDDTPAEKAGVKAGDLIIRLNEKNVKGMSLEDAVGIMRGKPDTDIELAIVREGADKPLNITITRAIIKIQSVRSKTLDKGFGYIRVSAFQERTGADLRKAIAKLNKEHKELKGLVLDLRNNPGGLLSAAVEVSDAFLDGGVVVSIKGRDSNNTRAYSAKGADLINGAPVVVLINGGSASASEIVAGALQDHKRGIIMGVQSFGKASVQTVIPLGNGSALKLTTARYYTPNGTSIQAKGITPDIVLDDVKVSKADNNGFKRTKEKDLSGHLENGDEKEVKETKKKDDKDKTILAKDDYALYEALNLLKGLSLVKNIQQ